MIDGNPAFVSLVTGLPVSVCLFSPNSQYLATFGDSNDSITSQTVVRGWDALTGEQLFVRPISRICARFPFPSGGGTEPWLISFACFSTRGEWLHLLTAKTAFVSINVDPFAAKPDDFVHEVVLRTGALVDARGNSVLLDSHEVVKHWSPSSR